MLTFNRTALAAVRERFPCVVSMVCGSNEVGGQNWIVRLFVCVYAGAGKQN
jgi:hypothetical protein